MMRGRVAAVVAGGARGIVFACSTLGVFASAHAETLDEMHHLTIALETCYQIEWLRTLDPLERRHTGVSSFGGNKWTLRCPVDFLEGQVNADLVRFTDFHAFGRYREDVLCSWYTSVHALAELWRIRTNGDDKARLAFCEIIPPATHCNMLPDDPLVDEHTFNEVYWVELLAPLIPLVESNCFEWSAVTIQYNWYKP